MRLVAVCLAAFALAAGPGLAQNTPVLSFSQVSYSLPADAPSPRGLLTGNIRDVDFDMGRPEGAEFGVAPVRRAAPQPAVRNAQARSKKAFRMPWQTGIFQ